MSRPAYQHVEVVESLILEGRSDAYARLELGPAPDGLWLYSASVSMKDWGCFSGLGWWPDLPRDEFASRDEALTAGIDSIRKTLGARADTPAGRRITAWLDNLSTPKQADLFAA